MVIHEVRMVLIPSVEISGLCSAQREQPLLHDIFFSSD